MDHSHGSTSNFHNTFTDKLSVALDRWWPVLLITFGLVFVLGIPTPTLGN